MGKLNSKKYGGSQKIVGGELASPTSAGVCYCTLELKKKGEAEMLRGFTATDVAAIGGSFWRVEP